MSHSFRAIALSLLFIAMLALAGCAPAGQEVESPTVTRRVPTAPADVPRMTPQELKALVDAGEDVVIVDTRSNVEYRSARIPGSVSMPLAEIPTRYAELPMDQDIVLYCT